MRFSGERTLETPSGQVWDALHDREVLRRSIPGCVDLTARGGSEYAATLAARVGPVADTYRGSFRIEDLAAGSRLRVGVQGRGRCGRLEIDLRVRLGEGLRSGTTVLRYDADAAVSGLVARLGSTTLGVAGAHLTACFFRDLDRSIARRARRDRAAAFA